MRSATWAPVLHVAASCKSALPSNVSVGRVGGGKTKSAATVADSRVRCISRCSTAFTCSTDGDRTGGGLEGMSVDRIR